MSVKPVATPEIGMPRSYSSSRSTMTWSSTGFNSTVELVTRRSAISYTFVSAWSSALSTSSGS